MQTCIHAHITNGEGGVMVEQVKHRAVQWASCSHPCASVTKQYNLGTTTGR